MKKFKNFSFLILLIFFYNCSFDKKTSLWKKHNKNIIEKSQSKSTQNIFKINEEFNKEIQNNKQIYISKSFKNKNWPENNLLLNNSVPHLFYKGKKNQILKSKKIGKNIFSNLNVNSEPLIYNNNILFSDLAGNIYKYSLASKKLTWKYNFYKKKYKNIPKKINMKISNNNLILSDNLGFFYKINLDTGDIVWAKSQGVPITSDIKIFNQKVFLLNQDNKFYIFNEKNGNKIIDFETFPVILKKNNKQTLSLDNKSNLYFVTSAGQLFSLNHENYRINWLKNIQDINTSDEFGLFSSSPIIAEEKAVYISLTKLTLSIEPIVGKTNWEIPFGSKIRPIISKNNIFLVSESGFLLNANTKNGEIIWSKKIFNSEDINLKKMGKVTSLLLISNQLLMVTKKGYFIFLNYQNGDLIEYAKVAKGFYSKPVVANGNIYIIDKNKRVLAFN